MKVIGPLMWEHRLIERMVALMRTELQAICEGSFNSKFIDTALDFFRTYAERLHFRKEEDILFASLGKKKLSAELAQIMAELIEEHAKLKEYVDVIVNVHNDTDDGGSESLRGMIKPIEEMLKLYPSHTEKEDKHFFYPCLEYLSQQEQDEMLKAFQEFDSELIHQRYQDIVVRLENTLPSTTDR